MKLTVLSVQSDVLWIFSRLLQYLLSFVQFLLLLYKFWLFVKPGLHPNEQKMTLMYIPVLSILFIAGLCFGYFVVMPFLFHFFNYYR
ncbi:hypothetical protein CMV37_03075 [Bacillus cereus]|nr:hypothetical protein CMV37_03075 [Bacillus cereus]